MDEELEPETTGDEGIGFELSFLECRVLGSLLEKEATTPAYYPMTLNGLQAACNQKSNREPVTEFDEASVERGVEGLRAKHLAVKVHLSGSRAPKYKHSLDQVLHVSAGEQALLCVLMLRGAQTVGELNQRTERLHEFGSVERVEETLEGMSERPDGPLVRKIPAGKGRRVATFVHLLGGEPDLEAAGGGGSQKSGEEIVLEEEASWRQKLEDEVQGLRGEVAQLREELDSLRRQFE